MQNMIKIGTCKVQLSGNNRRIELIQAMREVFRSQGFDDDLKTIGVYIIPDVKGVVLVPETVRE